MVAVPELKTLVIYKEGDKTERVVLPFLDDEEYGRYEIEGKVMDNCPFKLDFSESVRSEDNKVFIEAWDEDRYSHTRPKPSRVIEAELHTVFEIHGRTFKAEEI